MTNENQIVTTNGEVIDLEQVIQDTDNYQIVVGADGKARKKMKYQKLWSIVPETDEQIEELYRVTNERDNGLVKSLSECPNEEIEIAEILFTPYEKLNEDTFANDYGVTTTIKSTKGEWYATSSKIAYYQLKNMTETFGFPSEENYRPIVVKVERKKEAQGYSTNLRFVKRAK